MIEGLTRPDLEALLVKAMSRHIGYTAGAYNLKRILSLLEVFENRPSAYGHDLLAFLRLGGDGQQSEDYLKEVLAFSTSFGLLDQTSSRNSQLHKYSPTSLGRAVAAARLVGPEEFSRNLLTKVVFLADADSMIGTLSYYQLSRRQNLGEYYVSFIGEMRNARLSWLMKAIPEKILRARIEQQLPWLKTPKKQTLEIAVDVPSANTARHHTQPRKGWARELGFLERDRDALTSLGEMALRAFMHEGAYFWLGPPEGTQKALGIAEVDWALGPFEDTFLLGADLPKASETENRDLMEDVSQIMSEAYPHSKLIHAPQASLILPFEYIRFRSQIDRRSYDSAKIFDLLFREKRDRFDRLSALRGSVGFYRVK